jgi:AcrR family transcriptional regulator
MQGVLAFSPLEAGVRLCRSRRPDRAAPLSSVIAARLGTRITVALGMTGIAAGLSTMLLADAASGYAPVALSQVLLSLGLGTAMAPATASVMSVLPLDKAGVGSAVNDAVRMVGGALGVAVLGSVLSSGYRGGMEGAPAAARDSLGAALSSGDPALARLATDSFVSGMHTTAIVAAAVALAGAVLAAAYLPRGVRRPARRPRWGRPRRSTPPREHPRPRTPPFARGGRGHRARDLEVLLEEGFRGLSVDAVRVRAGVGKATIYRRFPDKEALVRAAIASLHRLHAEPPDTGSLQGDVETMWEQGYRSDPAVTSLAPRLLAESASNPEMHAIFRAALIEPRREYLRTILRRASSGRAARRRRPRHRDRPHRRPFIYRLLIDAGDPSVGIARA